MEVLRRFLQPPSGSFFLFGPRGTGTSTWLQKWFGDDALRLDLLDVVHGLIEQRPQLRFVLTGSSARKLH